MKLKMYNFKVYNFLTTIVTLRHMANFNGGFKYSKSDFERSLYEAIKDVNLL